MASSAQTEADYCCSICLEPFNDPVGFPCGHSFCKSCIERHWAVQSEDTGFTCPECREVYYRQPKLNKNVFIANAVENLKGMKIAPRPGRRCDQHGQGLDLYCRTDAWLICAGCMGTHRRHDIISVVEERGEKAEELGSMTQRLSEREGTARSFVSGLEESTNTMEAAAEQTKSKLSGSYDELLRLISEDKASALRTVDEERDRMLSGIRQQIEKSSATLRSLTEALSRIRSLEETEDPVEFLQGCALHWESFTSLSLEAVQAPASTRPEFETAAPLQEQIDELLRSFTTSRCLEPRPALQPKPTTPAGATEAQAAPPALVTPQSAPPSGIMAYLYSAFRGVESDEAQCGVKAAGASGEVATPQRSLSSADTDIVRSYGISPTLDTNSAPNNLQISLDLRTVTGTGVSQRRPDHPHRFNGCLQALCCESFSSGRYYWEVDVSAVRTCRIGVAYGTIARKGYGDECRLGENDVSWSLQKWDGSWSVHHGRVETPVSVPGSLWRVGVHLDWDAGLLAFYSADSMTLLHTVHETFTQPLYPGLWVGEWWFIGGSVSIVDLSRAS